MPAFQEDPIEDDVPQPSSGSYEDQGQGGGRNRLDDLQDLKDLKGRFGDLKDKLSGGKEAGEGAGEAAGAGGAEDAVGAGETASEAAGGLGAEGAAGAGEVGGGTTISGLSGATAGQVTAGAGGATAATGATGAAGAATVGGTSAVAAGGATATTATAGTAATGLSGPAAPITATAALVTTAATTDTGRKLLIFGCLGCGLALLGIVLMPIILLLAIFSSTHGASRAEAANPPQNSSLLVVKKTVSPSKIDAGAAPTSVTYTITVTNTSSTDASEVNLLDQVNSSPDSTFANEIATQINGQDSAANFNLGAGQTMTRTFTVTVGHTDFNPGWVLVNTAIVSGLIAGNTETSISTAYVTIGEVGCGNGGNFASLLPNPIPPHPVVSSGSFAADYISRLLSGGVLPAALNASLVTGVPCEILIGLHWEEASWWDDGSFISGRTIGNVETDINPTDCPGYGGTVSLSPSGCIFPDLNSTAVAAAKIYMGKIQNLFHHDQPKNFEEMIAGMACYNGCPGNANCGISGYNGPCPPPTGIDNPYVMNWFDDKHVNMYLLYCSDGTPCTSLTPYRLTDGALRAAVDFYLSGKGT